MNIPAHVYAFVLAAICVVGAVVLTAMNKTVPVELWQAAFLSAGAGAGIALPSAPAPAPQAPPVAGPSLP